MDTVAPCNTQSSTAIECHIQSLAACVAPGIADKNLSQQLGTVHVSNVLRLFYQGRHASMPFVVQGA